MYEEEMLKTELLETILSLGDYRLGMLSFTIVIATIDSTGNVDFSFIIPYHNIVIMYTILSSWILDSYNHCIIATSYTVTLRKRTLQKRTTSLQRTIERFPSIHPERGQPLYKVQKAVSQACEVSL